MRKFLAVLAAAATVGVTAVAVPGPATSEPGGLQLDGCIIRLLPTGPVALDDANHDCSPRVTGVSVNAGGDLVIAHGPVATVVSSAVTPDETLIDRNVDVGASVGLTQTIVRFAVNGTLVRADSATVTGSSSNIFIIWLSTPVAPSPSPTPAT
jgi:hypothetical protein